MYPVQTTGTSASRLRSSHSMMGLNKLLAFSGMELPVTKNRDCSGEKETAGVLAVAGMFSASMA